MSLNGRIGVPGWASIMVSIWFLGGLIIFCVGVIGMYLAKIFTEIKQRPYTIVRAEYRIRAGSAAVTLATLLRGQARDYYETQAARARSDAGGRGLELAGVAGAALRAARPALARRIGAPASWTTAAATARSADYLRARGHRGAYVGFDVSEAMAEAAHARVDVSARLPRHRRVVRIWRRPTTPSPAASSTSSRTPPTTSGARTCWETIADLAALGTRGFAFNALTAYSDADKRRPDLFYADPLEAVRSLQAHATRVS